MSGHRTPGAEGEVFADLDEGRVVARFVDPSTGKMTVELHLRPEAARDMAAALTAASITVEEER